MPMDWQQLLTRQRLGKDYPEGRESGRTCFQRDFDRLVFSSSFRRLKDKTQVFSLVDNDYIRTRLSHSIEASCVGRSLGRIIGEAVMARHSLENAGFAASDFGDILAAACLAHDIGNPPFGHVGEDAISHAFVTWSQSSIGNDILNQLTPQQIQDFSAFEGNAQGFSILTRLEMYPRYGGMCLTCPTLAAFMKYPRESFIPADTLGSYRGKSIDKHGFFQADKDVFEAIAKTLGLLRRSTGDRWWVRHPLALLVEAADDICYRIVDIEDGCHMGYVNHEDALELLSAITNTTCQPEVGERPQEQLKRLRACAINTLTYEAAEIFLDNENAILQGHFDEALLDSSEHGHVLKDIKALTKEQIFDNTKVLKIRVAAYEVLGTLFQEFITSAFGNSDKGKLLWQILPEHYQAKPDDSPYTKILKITDYISGMTDSYATSLFQQLKGMSLLG